MASSAEIIEKFSNDGINSETMNKMLDSVEEEISHPKFKLNFEDEDTLVELRRCFCDDLELLSRVGFFNPQNLLYDNDTPCQKSPGGLCSMYFCMCYEDEEDETWFTGVCSYCNTHIDQITDARRLPLFSGGFKGCFCKNPDCLHEMYIENESAVEHILIEIMNYYCKMIDSYHEESLNPEIQLNKINNSIEDSHETINLSKDEEDDDF